MFHINMLRIISNLKYLNLVNVPSAIVNKQSVRWRVRKPFALGTAKSKLFRVPTRPFIEADEAAELKRLFNNYRTQIKSLRRYFTYKYGTGITAKVGSDQLKIDHEEDFQRCTALNNAWNESLRIQREARFAKEQEENLILAESEHLKQIQESEQNFLRNEAVVREEIEASKTFITEANIDAAIENAINNTVDYNYAIDLAGNKIVGRETSPKTVGNIEKEAVKQ